MNSNGIIDLRKRLAKNLKRLIGNPEIEAKELSAFDLIMNRRQFLKAAQFAAIGALVSSAYPPTAWGRHDPKLKVNPKDVGLTVADMASVTPATQLVSGTELFQDTIYAQPVVAPEAVNSHALIEGARGRLRLQSDLSSTDPEEEAFLDTGYHFGPPELIQLEQDANDDWELVHYYYPWSPRTDGPRTDGLVRQVIMTKDNGLTNPTKVLTITGSYSNLFKTGATQISGVTYGVVVEDSADPQGGFFCLGIGTVSIAPPYIASKDYPVVWISLGLSELEDGDTYQFADKYTNTAYQKPAAAYVAAHVTEHIVLYYKDSIKIFSIIDTVKPGFASLMISSLPYPIDQGEAAPVDGVRLVHIDWDPTKPTDSYNNLTNIVLMTSGFDSDNNYTVVTYSSNPNPTTSSATSLPPFSGSAGYSANYFTSVYDNKNYNSALNIADPDQTQNGDLTLDYTTVQTVNSLYPVELAGVSLTEQQYFHLKIANFVGRGLALFAVAGGIGQKPTDPGQIFRLDGQFPLAVPDAAGLGTITNLSGGTSKFGGFRFTACDADGNVFLLRQPRSTAVDSPYAPPIYGPFDADGNPLPDYVSDTFDQPPATTSSNSNLNTLQEWVAPVASRGLEFTYNFMLNAALAFGSDDTNLSQAVWLGNTFKASYALSRYAHDSEHVVVKEVQSGDTDIYAVYAMIKNPVDKTWRQRQIATQTLPMDPGLQENGDHYQATITPVNAYFKPVSLLSTDNENLLIEVRADSPCTVIDDTNNLYYDIDRYTSFMASPDSATARLCLVVKAETFGQILYVRLVDSSELQPSSDPAMLAATSGTTYAWQSVNLALQAQQRMGNGAPSSTLLSDNLKLADTTVYISSDTLSQSNQQSPWQTKGSYTPTSGNLANLATYLNTSGQNLVSASSQLSLGASADGQTIDPLYAVTTVPSDTSRTSLTTQFAYNTGSISTAPPAFSPVIGGAPGSIFSSISHALSDALHWLQHVQDDAYKDLASGGVQVIATVDNITVTVGQDIMKQVNGVDSALTQVVSTVEEYASIVANLVVTIVESTYLYKLIETLIALISLFLYFQDVLDLSDSFKGLFNDILSGSNGESIPSIPSSFSSWDAASTYLGPNNTLNSAFSGVDSTNVGTELVQGLLDAIAGNPLTKKILNKITSTVSNALGEAIPTPPLSFSMDQSAAQGIMADITNLMQNLVEGAANMTEQTANALIQQLAADVADPQLTFQNLADGLGPLSDEIASDVLTPVFDFVDEVTTNAPTYAQDMINQNPYITIDLEVLADLCKLFGIGTVSNTNLTLAASDAVYFPLALIAWVAVYEHSGISIKSVDQLDDAFATAPGTVGTGSATLWDLVRLAVDGVMTELLGFSWLVKALTDTSGSASTAEQVFAYLGVWFNWIRWMNDFVYTCANWDPTADKPFDYAYVALRLTTASADVVFTLPGKGLNPGDGWPTSPTPTDMSQFINVLLTLAVAGYDTYLVAESSPDADQIVDIAGEDFWRSQIIAIFLYNLFSLKSSLEYFAAYILTCPFGFEMQILILGGATTSPGAPGSSHGKKRRRRRRRLHGTGSKYRGRRIGWHR